MKVNILQAKELIVTYIKAGLVTMLVGSPGCGKSDLVRQIAEEFNLKVIDLRLAQCDPTDLNGFPNVMGDRAGYLPMNTFPLEGDPIPEGYSGWLLFMDEFNSAPSGVQAAAYKITLDKMVGQYKLHPKLAMVCAGNLETDNAIVNPMSTAMQSRLAHIELEFDFRIWLNWCAEHGFDYRINSYINFAPKQANTFSPDHTDHTFACPRTWGFANNILRQIDIGSSIIRPALSGVITEGVAREFLVHCQIHETLPKIPAIIANPDGIVVPSEPGTIWAMTGSIAQHLDKTNAVPLVKYIKRFPKEFQVVCVRETVRRNKTMLADPAIQKWVLESAIELF